MPQRIRLFAMMMYASLAIGIVNALLEAPRIMAAPEFQQFGNGQMLVAVTLFSLGTIALLVYLIASRQQSWARIALLVLLLLGLPAFVPSIQTAWQFNPPVAVLMVVQGILQYSAMYLVFTEEAKTWFARA